MCKSRKSRQAFTLIELLVVITIIGILAGLLIPAVFGAIKRAKIAAIAMELTQLGQAIENYKSKKNDYPPDFSNAAAVTAHFIKAYPRSSFNVAGWLLVTSPSPAPARLDPAEALVFWLSGTKNDPRNPITGTGSNVSYFDFDLARLTDLDGDGWPEYMPKYTKSAPYVYFDGRDQSTAAGVSTSAYFYGVYPPTWSAHPVASSSGARPLTLVRAGNAPGAASASFGITRPYRSNIQVANPAADPTFPNTALNNTSWVNVAKYQIICPGMDNEFGIDNLDASGALVFKQYPSPNYYNQTGADPRPDEDNTTNFSEGRTLSDARP